MTFSARASSTGLLPRCSRAGSCRFPLLLIGVLFAVPQVSWAQPVPSAPPLPVVLVPATIGSELELAGQQVWPNALPRFPCPLDYHSLLRLQMLADGTSRVRGIVASRLADHPLFRPYLPFVVALAGAGFRVYPFPYDWRQDPATTAEQLAGFVRRVRAETGAAAVHVVAHSLGGLVAKAWVAAHPGDARTLIFVAVPHLGTAKAFKALRYGDPLHPLVGLACGTQIFKRVVHNMPSIYHLLPSADFFRRGAAQVGDARYFEEVVDLDGDGRTGMADTGRMPSILKHGKEVLYPLDPADPPPRETLAGQQLDQAAAFHGRQDGWAPPAGVEVYDIVGTNRAGIFRLAEFNLPCIAVGEGDRPCPEAALRRLLISSRPFGDGTVPRWSAEGVPAQKRYWYDASRRCAADRPRTCWTWNDRPTPDPGESHALILQDPQAQRQIINVLRGRPDLLAGPRLVDAPPAISDRPWTSWSAGTETELHLFDEQNRHTGPLPDGRVEEGIPDTYVEHTGGTFVIAGSVPWVRVLLISRRTGPLHLRIEESRGPAVLRVLEYRAAPLPARTRLSLTFRWGGDVPLLPLPGTGHGGKMRAWSTCVGLRAAACPRGDR